MTLIIVNNVVKGIKFVKYVIVVFLWLKLNIYKNWKNVCTDGSEYVQFFFISVLPLEIQLSREDGWDPLTGLVPPHVCACQRLVPGFPTSGVVFSMLNELRWEIIVRFVDILIELLTITDLKPFNFQLFKILFLLLIKDACS